MRAIHILIPFVLVLLFSSVSFSANCGGNPSNCTCGDTVTTNAVMQSGLTGCSGSGLMIYAAVTLDCNGHEITGSGTGTGIDASGSGTVKNCDVSGFNTGIYAAFSGPTLINNTLHNNTKGLNVASVWGAKFNDTHLYDNDVDYTHQLGSTDGPLTIKNMTFDSDVGGFVNETSLDAFINFPTPVSFNWVTIDHSPPVGAPSGKTSFGSRYLNITAPYSEGAYFNGLNWTWDVADPDSGGVELWSKNTSDSTWYNISGGDETNNVVSLTNHLVPYGGSQIYGLMTEEGATPISGCVRITSPGSYIWTAPSSPTPISIDDTGTHFGTACIAVESAGVTLECQDLADSADAAQVDGSVFIHINQGNDDVTIRNCNITTFGAAITANINSQDIVIQNVTFFNAGDSEQFMGMQFYGVNNLELVDVKIVGADPDNPNTLRVGILMKAVNGANFTRVSVANTRSGFVNMGFPDTIFEKRFGGIEMDGCSDVALNDMTFYGNLYDLHSLSTENITASNLDFRAGYGASEYHLDLSFVQTGAEPEYTIDYKANAAEQLGTELFEGKAVELWSPSGVQIDFEDLNLTWSPGESAGYTEGVFDIMSYNPGAFWERDATLSTVGNYLFLSQFNLSDVAPDGNKKEVVGIYEDWRIEECGDILYPGEYYLAEDLTGEKALADYCIGIQADYVILNMNGHNIRQSIGDIYTGSGIYVSSSNFKLDGFNEWGDEGRISRYDEAVYESKSSSNVIIDPVYLCDNNIGILVNGSNNSLTYDTVLCNNTQYGIYVLDADNTTIRTTRAFNNSVDFRIENNLGSPVTLNITSLRLDNPLGNNENFTDVSIIDSVAASTAYEINWSGLPGGLPGNHTSFENKYVDVSGTGPIDSFTLFWSDTESIFRGYNESLLSMWEFNGTWSQLSATLDTLANTLTYANLNPLGQYGILYNGSLGIPATLFGANVSNVTDHGRYLGVTSENVTTEGGNITQVDANTTQLTERWAAFYGNVSGGILLRGASSPNHVYQWAWSASDGGVVCVSTNSTLSSFMAYPALGSDIDSAWSLTGSATDSGERTFNETSCSLDIGLTTVQNASYADTGPAGGFMTCAAKTTAFPAKSQMLFCSEIIDGGTAWNGATVDYELLVPTPESEGSTETYYFYANLN